MATMTSDQLSVLATKMSDTQVEIDRLEAMGAAAPKGKIRGLYARLEALKGMFPTHGALPIEKGHAR